MQNDKITLKDLSIFTADGTGGVFELLNHAITQAGKDVLRKHIQEPPATYEQLQKVQQTIVFWTKHLDKWPQIITNGTLVMLEKFFEAADSVFTPPSGISLMLGSFFQKMLNKNEYFFTQFSLSHLGDMLRGSKELVALLKEEQLPELLKNEIAAISRELDHRLVDEITGVTKQTSYNDLSKLSYNARREMKSVAYRLMAHFSRLDAWRSMAIATMNNKWVFPELLPPDKVSFEAKALYHPLLEAPISYDIALNDERNFLLITGANMSGKTTFMRSLGVSALLAHLGMGVPAASLRISFLQGVITNMQVEDNIFKGESYFFAEVQRMKTTAEKLLQPASHLVLMDELFKGTNVHDAYECTRAVVEGLLNHPNHIMILSTHLYEVAQHFSENEAIIFAYFVTQMGEENNYKFTYELKNGISNDRIGYKILQKEGIIDLLKRNK